MSISVPQSLAPVHRLILFDSGEPNLLDEWLNLRALVNQLNEASRTFVVTNKKHRAYGYYAIAAGAVSHQMTTRGVRRNMPDPVPVTIFARLAMDHRAKGIKLGGDMLLEAVNRAVGISQNAGVRAFLVHALHDGARQVYEHYGFQISPAHPMTLMLRLNTGKP